MHIAKRILSIACISVVLSIIYIFIQSQYYTFIKDTVTFVQSSKQLTRDVPIVMELLILNTMHEMSYSVPPISQSDAISYESISVLSITESTHFMDKTMEFIMNITFYPNATTWQNEHQICVGENCKEKGLLLCSYLWIILPLWLLFSFCTLQDVGHFITKN